MTTLYLKKSLAQSPLRPALLLIALVFACFALLSTAQAVSPAPDGGYPGGNTAEGQKALFSLTSGGFNTAVGFFLSTRKTLVPLKMATAGGRVPLPTPEDKKRHA